MPCIEHSFFIILYSIDYFIPKLALIQMEFYHDFLILDPPNCITNPVLADCLMLMQMGGRLTVRLNIILKFSWQML